MKAELPAAARDVRRSAQATMGIVDWGVAIACTSAIVIMGKPFGSTGRVVTIVIVQAILLAITVATVFRGAESLLAIRRALSALVHPEDVVQALAPTPTPPTRPFGLFTSGAIFALGCSLAMLTGVVNRSALPANVQMFAEIATWFLPPLIVQHSLSAMRHANGPRHWLFNKVYQPVAVRLVRWLGGGNRTLAKPSLSANASTEVRLSGSADDTLQRLQEIDTERAISPGSLGTTIVALEGVRLDLLRLDSMNTTTADLTDHLEVVRELQRQVDAATEVHRLLANPSTELASEPTPV